MSKLFISLLLAIIFYIGGTDILAQKFKIATTSVVDFENRLVITYDILNSKPSQTFNVSIEITGSAGNLIAANALSGDIGEKIKGGTNKQIIWDYNSDKIVLFDKINIEVIAQKMDNEIGEFKTVSTGKALLLSAIVPGLGMSKMHNGKPYWILGVAGYGCLGASYLYNKKANDNYTAYLENTDKTQNDPLLSKSQNQNQLSKTMAYTAIGIWGINLVWTAVHAKKMKQKNMESVSSKKLLFYAGYDPLTNTSGFTLKLNF